MHESVNYEAIYRWHPLFANADFPLWSEGSSGGAATMEGGDVLVIGRGAVLVGMSERTTPQAVERLARRLFAAGSASQIVALLLPQRRAFMHLDTVMTMVDAETFTKYAGLGMLPSFTIEPGDSDKELRVTQHPPEDMHRVIAAALGLDDIRVLTPTQDVHAAEREQWDDGCNVLTVSPGVVVAYERNATSNTHLRKKGVGGRDRGRERAGAGPWRPPVHGLSDRAGGYLACPDSLRGRNFLKELDFTPEEWRRLLTLSASLKAAKAAGSEPRRLTGKNIALIFEKTSTRTRCAFEVAAFDQGAHVTYLDPGGTQIGHKESMKDTARVLGRMYRRDPVPRVAPGAGGDPRRVCRRPGLERPDQRVAPDPVAGRHAHHDRAQPRPDAEISFAYLR